MSISATIRNQIKPSKTCRQANTGSLRTSNEYYSNTFGYSWKLNECLLIGRANNNTHTQEIETHKIRATKHEKPKITARYKFIRFYAYLFIQRFFFASFFAFVVVFATEKKCYEFKEMKTPSCSGNWQARTGFEANKDRKSKKKIKKKTYKKYTKKCQRFKSNGKFLPACDLV